METIQFDYNKFQNLKKAYEKAISNEKQVFVFDDREFLTSYAKYLIEYLSTKFDNPKLN